MARSISMLTVWGLVCLMASSALAAAPASGLDQPTTKLVRTLSADRHDAARDAESSSIALAQASCRSADSVRTSVVVG